MKPLVDEKVIYRTMEEVLGKDPSKAKILDLNKQAYRVGVGQARKLS